MFPKVAQKVATAVFARKWSISKWPKSHEIFKLLLHENLPLRTFKIQSGHTVGWHPQNGVNCDYASEGDWTVEVKTTFHLTTTCLTNFTTKGIPMAT